MADRNSIDFEHEAECRRVARPARRRGLALIVLISSIGSFIGLAGTGRAADTDEAASATTAKPSAHNDMTLGTGPNAVVEPIRRVAPVIAARTLFGAVRAPAALAPRAIGFYSKGCLAGGQRLAVDGPEWQAMRLSRNRGWGHPALISFLERLAADVHRLDGWPGLLIGDMSQPRGGPMLTGHASHQVGLDADIWLTPMPKMRLTAHERETTAALSMLASGDLAVDPKAWTGLHLRLIKRAASFGEVERIFVHPAIKKAICDATIHDVDRVAWLHKVRPMWGHDHHFHVRIACPAGTAGCQVQPPPAIEDGCGKELTDWFAMLTRPKSSGPQSPPPPPLTLDKLPADCTQVLIAGSAVAAPPK